MEEVVYTYPIISLNSYTLEELVFYDAYRKFRSIFGDDVKIRVITTLSSEEIRKYLPDSEVIKAEGHGDKLNEILKGLYRDSILKIEKRRRYYCGECDRYYLASQVKWTEEKTRMNVIKVRIGKKLYFIDLLEDGDEPFGIAVNEDENLLAVDMEEEIWVSSEKLRDVLVDKLEVPRRRIKKWRPEELLNEEYKLQNYVLLGPYVTGFITAKNRDEFTIPSVMPSYTIIYSLEKKTKIPQCPRCDSILEEVDIPIAFIEAKKGKISISSEEGEYRIPILYCQQCGHTEIGDKIKECPVCGNIMSMPFFIKSEFLYALAYPEEVAAPSLGIIHQKRSNIMYLLSALSKEVGHEFFNPILILRHEPPEKIKEDVRGVLLSKKRGGVKKEDLRRIDKLKNLLINIKKYIEIYGSSEMMDPLDQWLINEVEKVKRRYMELVGAYNFASAFDLIYKFVMNDFSHFYIPMKRPYPIVKGPLVDVLIMLYPYLPSFSQEILSRLGVKNIKLELGEIKEEMNVNIVREIVKAIRRYRRENNIPRREPIKKIFFVSPRADEVSYFTSGIMKMENILLFNPTERWEEMEIEIVPNLEAISEKYRALASKIAFLLRRKNVKEIMDAMNKGGYSLGVEGFIIKITPNMLRYVEKMPAGYVKLDTPYGPLYVLKERDISTERLRFVNEIVRRINFMRKDLDLDYDDLIDVSISGDEKIIREIRVYSEEIRGRCRIRNMDFKYKEYAYVVIWPILDHDITIAINPLFKKWVIKAFKSIPGIAENKAETLFHMGYGSIYELMQAPVAEIAELPGFSMNLATRIKEYLYTHAFKSKKIGSKTYCPFCGVELGEEDIFCPRCGAPIKVKLEETKEIREGHIYLFLGDFHRLLANLPPELKDERKILITKENPENARKIYDVKNAQIIWISYVPLGRSIKPKELDRLKAEITKMIDRGIKIVLMDCFDFLLLINEMDRLKNFLMELKNIIKSKSALFLFNVEEIEEETLSEILTFVDGRI